MRIPFKYKNYPYSSTATILSYLANLLLALDFLLIVPVIILAIAYVVDVGISKDSLRFIVGATACIGYILLYIFVAVPKIEEIAEEDRKELVRKSLPELKGKKIKLTKEDFEK